MRSLNTYNYREEVGFNAINYNVSISDDDKIIRIEEDGSLIAELAFALSNNTLILNGKDGLEVAEIELPIALSEIKSQNYNATNKSIELEISKTNGESIIFELDVAELVNVYTAGEGIDINAENVISIKIKDKDNNILSVSEEGLDISLDTLAKTSELENLESKVSTLSSQTNNLANQVVSLTQNIVNGFNTINSNMSNGFDNLNQQDVAEIKRAMGVENELKESINSINEKLGELKDDDATIADEIASLKEVDADIYSKLGELEGSDVSVAESLKSLESAISEEAKIREEKDKEILDKLGELEGSDSTIADEIASLKEVDADIYSKLGELKDGDTTIAESLKSLGNDISEEVKIREEKDGEIINLLSIEKIDRISSEKEIKSSIDKVKNEIFDSIELVQDSKNKLHYILMVNDIAKGDINIPEDKMLEKVEYNSDSNELIFTWNTSTQQEPTKVDMSDLVDTYKGGDGVLISDSESGIKIISIPTDKTKYTKINENGQIEWTVDIKKDKSKPWLYHFNDKNGDDNNKVIDFTSDYENLLSNIQSIYAPLTYVNSKDESLKNELIGTPDDTHEMNTLYGLRAAIIENDSTDEGKIGVAKKEAIETAAADATAKDNALKSELKGYTDTSINELKNYTSDIENGLNQKYDALGEQVSNNSSNIMQLSTGLGSSEYNGGTGLFDELHYLFHQLIHGMDENNLKGKIQELIDKVDALQNTLSVLTANEATPGSISNMVSEALKSANSYSDSIKKEAIEIAIADASTKYQPIGDYVTNIELERKNYIDETELANKDYVDNKSFNLTLATYLTKDEAVKTYQPIGNYLTNIPSEYVTESELLNKGYATTDFVREQDSKLLTKELADALYQTKSDGYVTIGELNSMDFANKSFVIDIHENTLANETLDYVRDHFISKLEGPFVTHEELGSKNYITKDEIEEVENNVITNINTTLESYPTTEYVEEIYATKVEVENLTSVENISNSFEEGANIKIDKNETNNKVKISVKLSPSYTFDDEYNQNLPVADNNLDEVAEKLSEAIKNLYDATDGEMF